MENTAEKEKRRTKTKERLVDILPKKVKILALTFITFTFAFDCNCLLLSSLLLLLFIIYYAFLAFIFFLYSSLTCFFFNKQKKYILHLPVSIINLTPSTEQAAEVRPRPPARPGRRRGRGRAAQP